MKHCIVFIVVCSFLISCSEKQPEAVIIVKTDSLSHIKKDSAVKYSPGAEYEGSYESILKEEEQTIITNETALYEDSLLKQSLGTVLPAGTPITVIKYSGSVINGNWSEPVYSITYEETETSQWKQGYIAQSKLATLHQTLADFSHVYLTLDYDHHEDHFFGTILLTDKHGKPEASKRIDLLISRESAAPYSYYYYFSFSEYKKTGLDGVVNAFSIYSGYDACGYESIEEVFFWNGKRLTTGPGISSVSEAGLFYYSSSILLPADSLGKEGYITNIIEHDELIEEPMGESTTSTFRKDSTVILYKWPVDEYTKGDTIVQKSRTYTESE